MTAWRPTRILLVSGWLAACNATSGGTSPPAAEPQGESAARGSLTLALPPVPGDVTSIQFILLAAGQCTQYPVNDDSGDWRSDPAWDGLAAGTFPAFFQAHDSWFTSTTGSFFSASPPSVCVIQYVSAAVTASTNAQLTNIVPGSYALIVSLETSARQIAQAGIAAVAVAPGATASVNVLMKNEVFSAEAPAPAPPSPNSPPSPSPSPVPAPAPAPAPAIDNVLPVTVGPTPQNALCGTGPNTPCTTVTVCQSGTSNCQTIDNILLDTGSSGLRIFSSVLTVPVALIPSGTGDLAECVSYADNSSEWGQVGYADIKLAGEPAVRAPIEVINFAYAVPPAPCSAAQSRPDMTPSGTGFNGILGISTIPTDCGSLCATQRDNGEYYSCVGASCEPTASTVQVTNPITLLPIDSNGLIFQLAGVPTLGSVTAAGTVTMGIGTRSNNQPDTTLTTFPIDATGLFRTTFTAASQQALPAFIDSGSSLYYIPEPPSIPECPSGVAAGLFCPASPATLTATAFGINGSPSKAVSFQVADLTSTLNSNFAFDDSATGPIATELQSVGNAFDWGLPFFYGRSIYFGYQGGSTPLGVGPFYAY